MVPAVTNENDDETEPHDLDAEQCVLGGMMLSQDAISDVVEVLRSQDFYRPAHQVIYDVILDIYGRGVPVDPVTVAAQLTKMGEATRTGGAPYIHTLVNSVPTAANAGYYAGIVAVLALRRDTLRALITAVADLKKPGPDVSTVISRLESTLFPDAGVDTMSPHLPGLPTYPVDGLIGPLADLVKTGAATGLPVPYLAGAGLAALATVSGNAELRLSKNWMVRPVLWVPLIGPAGSAKTPSINVARARLRELDSAAAMDHIAAWDLWQSKPARDRDEPPKDERLLVDDATLEAVALRMSAGDGTLGVDSDELSEWLSGLSRYRSGGSSDRTRWLSSWSSSPWTVDRAGGRKLHIPRPVVSICGGLQPHLTNLLGPDGDGMRPRWLPHPSTDLDLKWRPGEIAQSWDETITRLYEMRHRRIWELSDESLKIWESAKDEWKRETRGSEAPSVIAALAKADEQTLRIALVLAESEAPGFEDGLVNADQVRCAIGIVDYVLDVWRAMPGGQVPLALSRRDEVLDVAVEDLAAWLERQGGSAARRDIQRARVAGVRTPEALDALLRRYEDIYPGSVRAERTGKAGPPSKKVYAPRRGTLPRTVTGDSSTEVY